MPEIIISPAALGNLAHHLVQEARYFEQEGEADHAAEFKRLADDFDEATSSGVRELTLRISSHKED